MRGAMLFELIVKVGDKVEIKYSLFKSLNIEFELEKNSTRKNIEDIKVIKKDIALIKQNIMFIVEELNRLNTQDDKKSVKVEPINIYANKSVKQQEIKQRKAIVKINNALVRKNPKPEALVVDKLKLGDIVLVKECDRFDWCKIEQGYIARFLLNLN